MGSVRWLGVLAATAIFLGACASPTQGHTASATRKGDGRLCPGNPAPPAFVPSQASNRNLEIVWFKGTRKFTVRDITDILHPTNIRTFEAVADLKFVSATEVSYVNASRLIRSSLEGTAQSVLVACGGSPFDWSPDGTSLAYTAPTGDPQIKEVRLLRDGKSTLLYSFSLQGMGGCFLRVCSDKVESKLSFSPNGAFLSFVQSYVQPTSFRLWTPDGKLIKSLDGDSATMSVWSGNALYWRTDSGVMRWLDGSESLVLPGVAWVRPHGSPAGGQIVYETRDSGVGTAHVFLFDTASGKIRELAKSRSEPFYLNSHLIWYKQERPCASDDPSPCGPDLTTIETGKTFIYDLTDNTETESVIDAVWDAWPHAA